MIPPLRRTKLAVLSLSLMLAAGVSRAQNLTRISENASLVEGNDISSRPSITPDGRYVAFYSFATNLVPGDTNLVADIFVFDRREDSVELVSVGSSGVLGNGKSSRPRITPDGRFVAFAGEATNFDPTDFNGSRDVYLHDRDTDGNGIFDEAGGTSTVLQSVSTAGVHGNSNSSSVPRPKRFTLVRFLTERARPFSRRRFGGLRRQRP